MGSQEKSLTQNDLQKPPFSCPSFLLYGSFSTENANRPASDRPDLCDFSREKPTRCGCRASRVEFQKILRQSTNSAASGAPKPSSFVPVHSLQAVGLTFASIAQRNFQRTSALAPNAARSASNTEDSEECEARVPVATRDPRDGDLPRGPWVSRGHWRGDRGPGVQAQAAGDEQLSPRPSRRP